MLSECVLGEWVYRNKMCEMWGAFQQILCCFSFSLFSMWHCFHCGSPYRFPSVFIWYYVDGCCCVACSLLSLAVASPDALCMYTGYAAAAAAVAVFSSLFVLFNLRSTATVAIRFGCALGYTVCERALFSFAISQPYCQWETEQMPFVYEVLVHTAQHTLSIAHTASDYGNQNRIGFQLLNNHQKC